MTQFQKGSFESYRATVSIHLGTRADYIPEGEVVQFDGYTLKLSDGEEMQVSTVKGAVAKGWLVPIEDQTSTFVPQSSGIEVHPAQQAGNETTGKMPIGTAVDDMTEVSTIAAVAEARKRAGDEAAARHGFSKISREILAELEAATAPAKPAPVHEQVKEEPRKSKFAVETRDQEPVRAATLKHTGAMAVDDKQVQQFAGASEPPSPVTTSKGSDSVVQADAQEAEAIIKLGKTKFDKVDITEDASGGKEVATIRPKMEKSDAGKKAEAEALAALKADGTLKAENIDRQSIEDVLDAAAQEEKDEAITTGDVEETIVGDELESLLPDAASSGTPEPGEAGEGDDPHLTKAEKEEKAASKRDPKVEMVRNFVPDFEWDLSRPWKERVNDAVDNHADNEVWLKAILAVESLSVKKKIQARLESR